MTAVEDERIPMRTKLAFGVGTMAESIALTAVGGYAMFYYNQVLGLSGTLAGLAITASLIVDGVVDPVIGSISDRTRSRFGRRHPFMFAAPLPAAISLFGVFNPPEALAGVWLFAWFLALVISVRFFMSLFNVPHLAMGGELAKGFTERTKVMSYSNFLGAIGTSLTSFLALTFFFNATPEYPRGVLNPAGYGPFSAVAAVAALIILAGSAWLTRDQIKKLPPPPDDMAKFSIGEFLRDLGAAFTNRNYLFLLIAVFFFSMLVSIRSGLSLYLNTFFWGLASEQIRWFALASFFGYLASFTLTARIHRHFGKRSAMAICAVLYGVIPGIPITLRLLGLMPGAESPILIPVLFVSTAIGASIGGVIAITALSALADIADQNELRYGLRQEGVLYSTRTVFSKIDSAVGHLLVGILLDVMQFPQHARPEDIDPQALWKLGLVDGPLAIIPGLIAAFFYARYAIDRASHEETRRRLTEVRAARNGRSQEPPPPLDDSAAVEAP